MKAQYKLSYKTQEKLMGKNSPIRSTPPVVDGGDQARVTVLDVISMTESPFGLLGTAAKSGKLSQHSNMQLISISSEVYVESQTKPKKNRMVFTYNS